VKREKRKRNRKEEKAGLALAFARRHAHPAQSREKRIYAQQAAETTNKKQKNRRFAPHTVVQDAEDNTRKAQ
jgi:hypothetical protein